MALRRELLPILLAAAFLLIGPAQALAESTWLDAEPQNATNPAPFTPPSVATDADGNSIAAWTVQEGSGDVRAIYRPRGGVWETTDVEIEPDWPVLIDIPTRAVALSDGSFVVVWIADRNNDSDPVLRSATRSASGEWTTEDVRDLTCCTAIVGLEAGGDGSVMVLSEESTGSVSNTKPSAGAPWGETQPVGIGAVDGFAVGPDGGAVAASRGVCSESSCIRGSYRPPGGEWGGQEAVGITDGRTPTGLAVAANPGGTFTVVWAALTFLGELSGPPSDVYSADRTAGPSGTWSAEPQLVAALGANTPGCDFGCVDLATGPDGRQLAAWQQTGQSGDQIAAAVRSAGGGWVGPETAGATPNLTGGPRAAITTTGVPAVAWASSADNLAEAHGSYRNAAGVWNRTTLGSSGDDTVYLDDLDADGDGNALTAFRHRGGLFTAALDAGGPRFSAVSIPAGGTVGQSLPFSAAAGDDNWSSVAGISWLFGDGTGADGASVSHAYGAAGTFTATARVADTVGNVTEQSGPVSVTQTPPPDPCGTADTDKDGIKNGCDDNNGAAKPVPFKTVNATVVSGEVFVKLPAGAASTSQAKPPKGFVRLEGAETIPIGSTLDTKRGRVKVRSAADTRRKTQTGQFYRGRFVIRQARIKRRSRKLITDMRLTGSSFRTCGTTRASVSQRRKRSKRKVRRLFGDAKGSFRTSGRNAAATVRGTRWGVQDRCDGTLVAVQRGRVEVRDKVKRKTIILRRGKTYLARAR
jgi:PKD domain-containing protein